MMADRVLGVCRDFTNYMGRDWSVLTADLDVRLSGLLEALTDFARTETGVKLSDTFFAALYSFPAEAALFRAFVAGSPPRSGPIEAFRAAVSSILPRGSYELGAHVDRPVYLDLGFYHRHDAYLAALRARECCHHVPRGLYTQRPICRRMPGMRRRLRRRLSPMTGDLLACWVDAVLEPQMLEGLVDTVRMAKMIPLPVRAVLTSAHGIYHPVSYAFLAMAAYEGVPVYVLQPGMPHTHYYYSAQVRHERRMATRYLGWGRDAGLASGDGFVIHGSYYGWRGSSAKHPRPGTIVLLPQLKRGGLAGLVSSAWSGLLGDGFESWVLRQARELKHAGPVTFRAKPQDLPIYRRELGEVEPAKINRGDRFACFERTVILYGSTAIVEALGLPTRLHVILHPEEILLHNPSSLDVYRGLAERGSLHDDPRRVFDGEGPSPGDAADALLSRYYVMLGPEDAAKQIVQLDA